MIPALSLSLCLSLCFVHCEAYCSFQLRTISLLYSSSLSFLFSIFPLLVSLSIPVCVLISFTYQKKAGAKRAGLCLPVVLSSRDDTVLTVNIPLVSMETKCHDPPCGMFRSTRVSCMGGVWGLVRITHIAQLCALRHAGYTHKLRRRLEKPLRNDLLKDKVLTDAFAVHLQNNA